MNKPIQYICSAITEGKCDGIKTMNSNQKPLTCYHCVPHKCKQYTDKVDECNTRDGKPNVLCICKPIIEGMSEDFL